MTITEMSIKVITVIAKTDIAGIVVTLLDEIAEIGKRRDGVIVNTTADEIEKEIETTDVIEIGIEIVEKPDVIGTMIDTRREKIARINHAVRGQENEVGLGGPDLVKEIMIEEEETITNTT